MHFHARPDVYWRPEHPAGHPKIGPDLKVTGEIWPEVEGECLYPAGYRDIRLHVNISGRTYIDFQVVF